MENSKPQVTFSTNSLEWNNCSLQELVERVKSYSLSRDIETNENTGYKYIHYGDIHTNVAGVIDDINLLPSIKNGNYEFLQKGDLVLADASEDYQGIAKPALVNQQSSIKLVAGLHTIALRPREIDPMFLYYLFYSTTFRKYGYRTGTGMKVFGISISNVLKFEVSFPPANVQKRVGEFFKSLDDSISIHQQELNTLKQTKQGFLQKMFPKEGKAVPEFRFNGYTQLWKKEEIGKVFDTITDYVANGSFQSLRENVNSYESENYAYLVRLQDASNQWRGPWLYTDEESYNFLKKTALYPKDIIMSNVGSVGKFFLVPYLDRPMTLAPNAMLIRSSINDNHFIYQMMLTKNMQAKILEKTTPGVQSKINKTDFKKIETYIPHIDEQIKIGEFFRQLDEVIELKEKELEALRETKKGFLQKMFI